MTTMYDSTNPEDIPADAEAVAGYVNGAESAWPAGAWDRFTEATIKRHISVTASNEGDTLDVENGDATIAQAPGWIKTRTDAGVPEETLWLYVDRTNYQDLRAAVGPFTGGFWVADWSGVEHDVEGAVATQYANPTTSGGHYDLSHLAEAAPAPDQGAGDGGGTTSEPQPPEEGFPVATMPTISAGSSGDVVQTAQSVLNGKAEAGLAVDGEFGPQTEAKVRDWQEVFHLTVDGIVGPQTWASLLLL